MRRFASLLLITAALALPASAHASASLRGSPASMARQHKVAVESDYSFLRTPGQIREFVEKGYLVPVQGNESYAVASGVSFPYARPELRTFVERLSAQYRESCGERLVVTSLTRPRSQQPANAHRLSVHPTGMAVDLRISQRAACRSWLERTLLSLDERGVLDAIRERNPPHYHVALFPGAYTAYLATLEALPAADSVPEPAAALTAADSARATSEHDAPSDRTAPRRLLACGALGAALAFGADRRLRRKSAR